MRCMKGRPARITYGYYPRAVADSQLSQFRYLPRTYGDVEWPRCKFLEVLEVGESRN